MKHYFEDTDAVLKELNTSRDGLSSAEAEKRLAADGRNKLADAKGQSLLACFLAQLADPMILILLGAALVSGILAVVRGESFADVIIILIVVLVNAVLGVYQENKAEKAIDALQKMSAATSKVFRDGKLCVIPSEELVAGDVIALEAGDAVPADARVLLGAGLKVEEAALTGESVAVDKTDRTLPSPEGKDLPLGDRKNMIYMGSTVGYGRANAVITATGMRTEMGKIADALANAKDGDTPLQKKLKELSKILTWLVLGISAAVLIVSVLRAGNFEFETILDSFMVAVSLAVAAIPEGLAAVVTVVLSIGVTNMSKRNAIIRKLTAVETLGCTQIICSDKTGTLTQNKMTVVESFGAEEKEIATEMALCSDAELNPDGTVTGEPTEVGLVTWAAAIGMSKIEMKKALPRVGEAPFDSDRKMMSTVHADGDIYRQCSKGAVDMILDRCTSYLKDGKPVPMTAEYREEILRKNKEMADKALRVLACALRFHTEKPASFEAAELERDMCFVGLTGMIDPVRPEVKAAIVKCREAGIRPIMITGDHVDTASAIARELGILTEGRKAITGMQLSEMDDEQFEKEFRDISVYARVQPEHKTRIVNAWRGAGFVTAMTGDGVNDAPSIKSADIGVGMGITGTDVTKNVADMVLADDNFATIVGAAEEGRRIYDNIRKAIQFLLGSNMSEVLAIFAASMVGFTILKPVHLLWINLVTDCFPALSLGMERAEANVMKRKPRDSKAGLFSGGMGIDIVYQGILVTALVFLSYLLGAKFELGAWRLADSAVGTTMAFVTMSLCEVFHSINMRSQRGSIFRIPYGNKMLMISSAVSLVATAAVVEIPFLANAFGFTSVSAAQLGIAAAISVMIIPLVEFVKLLQRKK